MNKSNLYKFYMETIFCPKHSKVSLMPIGYIGGVYFFCDLCGKNYEFHLDKDSDLKISKFH